MDGDIFLIVNIILIQYKYINIYKNILVFKLKKIEFCYDVLALIVCGEIFLCIESFNVFPYWTVDETKSFIRPTMPTTRNMCLCTMYHRMSVVEDNFKLLLNELDNNTIIIHTFMIKTISYANVIHDII